MYVVAALTYADLVTARIAVLDGRPGRIPYFV